MTKTSAILLAAGLSNRMNGPNKLLMPFEGKSIISSTYYQLSQSQIDEVIIVTGRDKEEITEELEINTSDRFVHNEQYASGMTSSIQKGVELAQHQAYMICLGDMPWLKIDHYNALLLDFKRSVLTNDQTILLPLANGNKANPVIFSSVYREAILNHTESNGCKQLVKANQHHLIEFITDDAAFIRDIDTPEDYEQLNK